MKKISRLWAVAAAAVLLAGTARAAEVKVMISGGFSAAYGELVPRWEKATGNTVSTARGPSMGNTPQAIPVRLQRGEPADVLIMVGYALDDLAKQGAVAPDSKVDLANSYIGVAVKSGAPKPDIATAQGVKEALLRARSVAYSDSASGVYIEKEMFPHLGIAEQMKGKARAIPAEPVGAVVARGEADLGFQQISELKPIAGIELVGPLPAELQKVTVFSAGIAAKSQQPAAARALIAYLKSPAAAEVMKKTGLDPIDK